MMGITGVDDFLYRMNDTRKFDTASVRNGRNDGHNHHRFSCYLIGKLRRYSESTRPGDSSRFRFTFASRGFHVIPCYITTRTIRTLLHVQSARGAEGWGVRAIHPRQSQMTIADCPLSRSQHGMADVLASSAVALSVVTLLAC